MFNLLVTAQNGAWDKPAYEYELGRAVHEYTADPISEKLGSFNEMAVAELITYPSLFMYEKIIESNVQIGWIKRIRNRSNSVVIEYEIDKSLPHIARAALEERRLLLDIEEWEFSRTHWAVKDVDLFSVLVDGGMLSADQVEQIARPNNIVSLSGTAPHLIVAPKEFSVAELQTDPDLVSVMMPFDAGFDPVYESIKQACMNVGLSFLRADDIWEDSTIVQDIFNLIYRSRIVIVDFSNRNSNVMYETGIAHTLGRTVIPISQSINDVPFDLRHFRILQYYPNSEGLTKMRLTLEERMSTIIR